MVALASGRLRSTNARIAVIDHLLDASPHQKDALAQCLELLLVLPIGVSTLQHGPAILAPFSAAISYFSELFSGGPHPLPPTPVPLSPSSLVEPFAPGCLAARALRALEALAPCPTTRCVARGRRRVRASARRARGRRGALAGKARNPRQSHERLRALHARRDCHPAALQPLSGGSARAIRRPPPRGNPGPDLCVELRANPNRRNSMASISVAGAHGARRLDHDLPLVPFIDFLLCLIAFLLVTAVWTQAARLSADALVPGSNGSSPALKPKELHVTVGERDFELAWKQGATVLESSPRPAPRWSRRRTARSATPSSGQRSASDGALTPCIAPAVIPHSTAPCCTPETAPSSPRSSRRSIRSCRSIARSKDSDARRPAFAGKLRGRLSARAAPPAAAW